MCLYMKKKEKIDITDSNSAQLPTTGFVRLPGVLAVYPVSRSAWWQGIKDGKYPRGVKLGPKTTAWRAEDIRALIAKTSDDNEGAA